MDEFRVARPADYDRIAAVVDEWWGRPIGESLPRLFLDHFWPTSRLVEDADGLAAFVVAFRSPGEPTVGYVHFVGVRPDRRRDGLGQRLYAEVEQQLRALGCRELRAITAPVNTGSIRFHERLGFVASTPVADYNGPGRPMVTFRRQF